MNLPKDVIIHILRILCKFSNSDCKNARLVNKHSSYDNIIFPELKSRFNKFVKHDLLSNSMIIEIPNYVLPSDDRIKSQIFTGLLDDEKNYDAHVLHRNIIAPLGSSNKFMTMLHTLYPESDFFLSSDSIDQEFKILNLNAWEIFNYPILNVSVEFPIVNLYIVMAIEDRIRRTNSMLNMLRFMIDSQHIAISRSMVPPCNHKYRSSELTKFGVTRIIDIIEGIYFHDEIPESIILVNGDQELTIKPTNRYLYLGMLRNGNYTLFNFIIPSNIKFKIIVWGITNRDEWIDIDFKSIFYDESNTHKTTVTLAGFKTHIKQEPAK